MSDDSSFTADNLPVNKLKRFNFHSSDNGDEILNLSTRARKNH